MITIWPIVESLKLPNIVAFHKTNRFSPHYSVGKHVFKEKMQLLLLVVNVNYLLNSPSKLLYLVMTK